MNLRWECQDAGRETGHERTPGCCSGTTHPTGTGRARDFDSRRSQRLSGKPPRVILCRFIAFLRNYVLGWWWDFDGVAPMPRWTPGHLSTQLAAAETTPQACSGGDETTRNSEKVGGSRCGSTCSMSHSCSHLFYKNKSFCSLFQILDIYRKMAAAKQKKRPVTKKEKDAAWKALRDREAIVKLLDT